MFIILCSLLIIVAAVSNEGNNWNSAAKEYVHENVPVNKYDNTVLKPTTSNDARKIHNDGNGHLIAEEQKHHYQRRRGMNDLQINLLRRRRNSDNNTDAVQSILSRLDEGERQIKYTNDSNAVLVLGNTGAGKSTLVQFLADHNLSSQAVLNSKNKTTGKYIIIDNNGKIGNDSINSHTEVPDLVLDEKTNTWFYDCPGFSDTRDAKHDIAGTYFIKKITDFVKKIKFIFVVNYSSVQKGYDKTDFIRLAKHAASMIKNITKFQDSIGIVASKVDNNESDEEIINTITAFLENVQNTLVKRPDKSLLDNNMIQFINALLTTNNIGEDQVYPRIGFFKKPKEAGLLSNMTIFQDNKKSLENLLHKNLKFIEHDNKDDFSYTISADSQIYVFDLIQKINKNISSCVADIENSVEEYYRISVQKMLNKINSFQNSMQTIDANVIEAESFLTNFNTGYNNIINLTEEIKNVKNADELSIKINNSLNFLNLNTLQNKISIISNQGRYLDFLANVSVSNSNSSGLLISTLAFHSIIKDLNESKNRIKNTITDIEYQLTKKIENNINAIGKKIEKHFSRKEEAFYDIKKLINDVESTYDKLLETQKTANNTNEIHVCIKIISDNIYKLKITDKDIISTNKILSYTVTDGVYLNFLDALSGESKTQSFRCADSLNNVIRYLDNSKQLYNFLIGLYERLSMYDIQLETEGCDNLLSNVGTLNSESIKVGDVISQKFMKKCYPEYKKNLKNITLTQSQLLILNRVLKLTLTSDMSISCDSVSRNKLVIKGQYVKLSDIKEHNCITPLQSIHIFALEKIFIDSDLNDSSIKELIIISPILEVQETHKIVLDGSPGKSQQKAESGYGNASNGKPGKPGLPGSPGGNFLGISGIVNNAHGLTISANGGQGGPGQSGGDGGQGRNGETASDSKLIKSQMFDKELCNRFRCSEEQVNGEVQYIVWGKNGGLGGNGGDGGIGGYGGHSGKVLFYSHNTTSINIKTDNGSKGSSGQGGDIGQEGTLGATLRARFISGDFFDKEKLIGWGYWPATDNVIGPENNAPGKTGNNNEGILNPEPVEFINLFYPINNYKSYLRENLIGNVRQSELKNFLNFLEDGGSTAILISKLYNTLGFLDEFYSLEQQFLKLHRKISFLPFYESLFNKVNQYGKRIRNNTSNAENQTLNYLRATIFSKIHGIKNDPEKNLVINVATYFDLVKTHITLYKQELKQDKINEYNNDYQKKIQNQIKEANNLINNDTLPEIYKILEETNDNIILLVNETMSQINIAQSEKAEIVKNKKKLQELIIAKTLLSCIEIASGALALAGPIGAAVGGGTALVAGVVETVVEQKIQENSQIQITALADSVSKPIAMVSNLLKSKKNNFQKRKKNVHNNNNNKKQKSKVMNKSKMILGIADEALQSYGESKDQIEDLDEDIQNVNDKIDKLEEYEENIYNVIIPMIKFIEELFTETRENLQGKSHAALDVIKWKMQSVLKDVQIQIREMTRGFNVEVSLTHCIEKFEFGAVTLIQMYDRIQDAYDKKQLVQYIADINSDVKLTTDLMYQNDINKLDLILRTNIFLNEYAHAMSAFQQYIFPFADMYLNEIEMSYTNKTLNDTINKAVGKITTLTDKVEKHSTVITPMEDNYFFPDVVFRSNFLGPGGFFVWKHDIYHEEISKLLAGQVITIKADVVKGIEHNAVKFNEIGLQFNLLNETLQQELNKQLQSFTVEMTHLGNSYYKCGDRFYIITHDQQKIIHHVTLVSGTYANENNVYRKIKDNPPILSPYTMWKIQLQNNNNATFDKLTKFANQSIDLELVGKGQYVDEKDKVCNDNLEKYYKVADIS